MKYNYFKITGKNNGYPIEPYGVKTTSAYPHESHFNIFGDAVRYYEPISKEEYLKLEGI